VVNKRPDLCEDDMFQDLSFGIRMLWKNPGFTLVAALSLALGIGVNTSVFTLIYSLAWRPLPVKDPAGVVNIHQSVRGNNYGRRSEGGGPISYPEYLNYRDQTRSFAGIAAYAEETLTLTGVEAERINAQMVTDNYFSVLGGETALGRVFVPNECQMPGGCPQVVLSYGFWQRRFGSDPNVIGKVLILNRQPFTVVGVTARSWSGMGMNGASQLDLPVVAPDVWVPLMMRGQLAPERDLLSNRDCSCHSVVGRLENGVSLKQAQAEMDVAAAQLDQNELVTNNRVRKTNVTVMPGTALNITEIRGFVIPFGIGLLAALGLVLVVACANVSNLLLARAVVRQKEIGVRLALGASRGRLIRQLMTESLLLALLGGAAGMLLASWAPPLVLSVFPIESLNLDLNPNWTVFAYCFLTSLLTAILFGLAPAFQATRLNVISMIRAEGTALSRRISGSRLRNLLVVTQVAVSFTLLVSAGLLFRGVQRAQSADLGFEPKNVFVLSMDLASAGYNAQRAAILNEQLNERLAALPGVESVSFSRVLPFSGIGMAPIILEGAKSTRPPPRQIQSSFVKLLSDAGNPDHPGPSFHRSGNPGQTILCRRQPGHGRAFLAGAGSHRQTVQFVLRSHRRSQGHQEPELRETRRRPLLFSRVCRGTIENQLPSAGGRRSAGASNRGERGSSFARQKRRGHSHKAGRSHCAQTATLADRSDFFHRVEPVDAGAGHIRNLRRDGFFGQQSDA
jgi:macrolide transport system ATP-binding/permease protein